MSSNEPIHATTEDETINVLNQAIRTLDFERLKTLLSTKTLDASCLIQAWQQYEQTPYARTKDDCKKYQVFCTLFDPCRYSEQQRVTLVNFIWEYALQHNKTMSVKTILGRLSPIDDILPLTTHLIQNRFSDLCQAPDILSQLLLSLPEDQWHAPCRHVMVQLRQMPEARRHAIALFKHAQKLEPLLKVLFCFLSQIPDPELTSLSDDWQTLFMKFCAKGQRSLLLLANTYGAFLLTGRNLVPLLALCQEDQRMDMLRALMTSRVLECLGRNGEQVHGVLMLLPKPQRTEWLLSQSSYEHLCDYIPDELWPTIAPLVEPSCMVKILRYKLQAYSIPPVTHLIKTMPGKELWSVWIHLSEQQRYNLFSTPMYLEPLLNQLPAEVQQSARKQLLTDLALCGYHVTSLSLWLQNERYFSILFPAANQWLNAATDTQNLPFNERLPLLATRSTALFAFLVTLPEIERRVLLPWLISTKVQGIDILSGLINQYSIERWLFSGNWDGWTDKMSLILVILEHLPSYARTGFTQRLSRCKSPWKPENYQAVRRACTLFGQPVEPFLERTGLNGHIPLTPLMQAVRNNDKEAAQEHIHLLNEQNWLGQTALMYACSTCNFDMIRFLSAQQGCDFSIRTLYDETVFAYAAQIDNTLVLQHLLRISPCKPTPQDAVIALCYALRRPQRLEFLFETFFSGIAWQRTRPHFRNQKACESYENDKLFRMYYDKATLPFVLLHKQLAKLTLDPNPFGIFRYQMQALEIDPLKALKLDYLLQSLSGHVPSALCLTGFHIDAHELPLLVDFVKNNPQLKSLSIGTLHGYPEDERFFVKSLQEEPEIGLAELRINDQPAIRLVVSRPSVRNGFFEHSTGDGMIVDPASPALCL